MYTRIYDPLHGNKPPACQVVRRIPRRSSTRIPLHPRGPEGKPLTAADHSPADPAVGQRSRTEDPPTPPQAAGEGGGPGLLNQVIENPLLSLFGAIIVVLLGSLLTTSNIRISETNERFTSLENRLDNRIDRLEDRIERLDGRVDSLDRRIGSLEGTVASIDRKLTALIAALGKTDEVEAALSADGGGIRTGLPLDETEDR